MVTAIPRHFRPVKPLDQSFIEGSIPASFLPKTIHSLSTMESFDDDSLYFDDLKAGTASDSIHSPHASSPSSGTGMAGRTTTSRSPVAHRRDDAIGENNGSHRPSIYSMRELIQTLGSHETGNLSPELQRRVLDFRLAQQKRKEKYGIQKRWGVFGLYMHLTDVRVDLEWAEDAAWRRQNAHPYMSWADFTEARQMAARPWFTYSIVLLCSIMMVVVFVLNGFSVEPVSANPMIGPSGLTLVRAGARDTNRIVIDNEWYRILTPLILHAGLIHYLINMLALWFIGGSVEQAHGSLNAMVLFFIPGVGGNLLSAIFLPQYISVGASGGIFGLMGGCLADIWLNWSLLFIKSTDDDNSKRTWRRNCCAVTFLVFEMMINVLLGLVTPFIDNWSHLGGLVYGICCAFSTIEPMDVRFFGVNSNTWDKVRLIIIRFFGLMISLFLIMATSIWLATSSPGETPCPGCRYISCVPFPFFREEKWWYCDDCDGVSGRSIQRENIYVSVELICPDDIIETIDISDEGLVDSDEVRRNFPKYCREYCASVFN